MNASSSFSFFVPNKNFHPLAACVAKCLLLVCLMLVVTAAGPRAAFGESWYVNDTIGVDDPMDEERGLSPDKPFKTIQFGIDSAADGDTVFVSDGTYKGPGNKNLDYGGRAINVTSQNGPANCVIDCEDDGRGFYFHNGEGGDAVVSGFTITHGHMGKGAGVYAENASPTISNCIITENEAVGSPTNGYAGKGAGIYAKAASPNIANCMITGNTVVGSTTDTGGGGIYCHSSSAAITACTITLNSANYGGGGVHCESSSEPTITNCTISNNSGVGGGMLISGSAPAIENCSIKENTGMHGGGVYFANATGTITSCRISGNNSYSDVGGGGIQCYVASPTVSKCIVDGNSSAADGGGMYCGSSSSPSIVNCVFSNNSCGEKGGAMAIVWYSSPSIVNTTFVKNVASEDGGGVYCRDHADPILKNCIFWEDSPDEIHPDSSSNPSVTYCDVQGAYPGEGNFHGAPLFVDFDNDDYHLSVSSPCMYAGTSDGAPTEDIEGNPRPQGYGHDLGAHETTGYSEQRPIIDTFSVDTAEDYVPFQVTFTCAAHDPDGEIAGFTMDYDDGTDHDANATGLFTHTYTSVGEGYATCTAIDDSGASANSTSIRILRHGDIHVPSDYLTIQAAIDAAFDGDTVVVSDDVYTGEGNKDLDFKGKAITVRSENGPDNCIINCQGEGRGFYFHSGEGQDSVLSGFTVTQGGTYVGAGIYTESSSPTITNCKIAGNSAALGGGGIYCNESSPVIVNCLVSGNTSGSYRGGGVRLYRSSPTITNCTIVGNSGFEGGGLCCELNSDAMLTNCIVWDNSPDQVYVSNSVLTITHSSVEGGWPGQGNGFLYPGFVDPAGGDYDLNNYSSCIGAGTLENAPLVDIEANPRPKPPGSNPDMGAYEHSLGIPDVPPTSILDVFGMEVGNNWTYEWTGPGSPGTTEREIARIDDALFPTDTYVFDIKENGVVLGSEWYQSSEAELRYWGLSDESGFWRFSQGLLVAWYPMKEGDHRESSANLVDVPGFKVKMTVDVLDEAPVALSFGTVEAFKLRYRLRIWGPGSDQTLTYYWWVAPYLGVVKQEIDGSGEQLASFTVGGGMIAEPGDFDGDGLTDYQEFYIYDTHWQYPDTDGDGCGDGVEVATGRSPTNPEPPPDPQGDVNSDCYISLRDAVIALQVLTANELPPSFSRAADVNLNDKIDSAEVVFILHKISGLR